MPLITTERDAAITFLASRYTFISLHTGDPGTTGANEVTGTGYARKVPTWGTASNGSISAGELTFDIPAGLNVTHFGYQTAATGATFRGGNPLAAAKTDTTAFQVKVVPTIPSTAS